MNLNIPAKSPSRIAIDAMGGDFAPTEIVKGSVLASRELDAELLLVGNGKAIESELEQMACDAKGISIVSASQVVEMDDLPSDVLKKKPDSSLVVAAELVCSNKADALISAGNTGAVMGVSLIKIGRIKSISRPAIGVVLPLPSGPTLLIDAGANVECKPKYLYQFAVMGSIYMNEITGRKPRVGLLNVGSESMKGNDLYRSSYALIKELDNFVGNIEGGEIVKGKVDVVVCDGFTGNVVLKLLEGTSQMMLDLVTSRFKSSIKSKMGGILAKKNLIALKDELDPEVHAGQLLLGVNGVCVICHGSSTAKAIKHALISVHREVVQGVVPKIAAALGDQGA